MSDTVLCKKCEATLTMRNVPESDLHNLSLLRSLYVPNNVEVSTIINMVSDADRDIAKYDEEIQRLEGLLNELREQLRELKCHREKTHTLLSPIRRLPVEVLEQIFDIACRSEFGIEVTQKSADPYTLELSQVCYVWRNIIRSKPALWSAMWIDLSHRNGARRLIEHYIEQSRGAPWTLFITASDLDLKKTLGYQKHDGSSDTDSDSESDSSSRFSRDSFIYEFHATNLSNSSRKMLKCLLRHSANWKDVTMRLSWEVMLEISRNIDFIFSDFNILESLKLDWDDDEDPDELPGSFMSSFSADQAPRLRHLSLPGFHSGFNFPFQQLKSFGTLNNWKNPSILALFSLCLNVDTFTIIPRPRYEGEVNEILQVSPPVDMFARSLSIKWGYSESAIGLLNSLIASRLEHLYITGNYGDEAWEESFTAFLVRSQCPLQTLVLKYSCIGSDQHLLQLLAHLPTLLHLGLYCEGLDVSPTVANSFIEGMTAVHESGILPRLQRLNLKLVHPTTVQLPTISQILTMAESRISSLRSLHLTVELQDSHNDDWTMDSNSLLRIQHLKGDGMHVSVGIRKRK